MSFEYCECVSLVDDIFSKRPTSSREIMLRHFKYKENFIKSEFRKCAAINKIVFKIVNRRQGHKIIYNFTCRCVLTDGLHLCMFGVRTSTGILMMTRFGSYFSY